MINIEFKGCCQECAEIDVDYDTITHESIVKDKKVYVTIGCAHRAVCKRYIEAQPKEPTLFGWEE